MEDLKNFTKRVFNKSKPTPPAQAHPSGRHTPPGPSLAKPSSDVNLPTSEVKKPKKVKDFADSDDEEYEEEYDDDNLRDDIGASFSAAGGST